MEKTEFLKEVSHGNIIDFTPETEILLNSCNLKRHDIFIIHQRKRDGQNWKNEGTKEAYNPYSLERFSKELYQFAYNTLEKADACYVYLNEVSECIPPENFEGDGFYTSTQTHHTNELVLSGQTDKLYYFNYDVWSHRIALLIF